MIVVITAIAQTSICYTLYIMYRVRARVCLQFSGVYLKYVEGRLIIRWVCLKKAIVCVEKICWLGDFIFFIRREKLPWSQARYNVATVSTR